MANRLNTVKESRERLGGIAQESFYKLVRTGQIRVAKIGRRTYVSDAELDRFIEDAAIVGDHVPAA